MILEKSQIPRLTSSANYRTDVPMDYIKTNLARYLDMDLDLNPDFQRGHVWNATQQRLYMEFLFKGGKGADILFNHPGWMATYKGDFVIVDGKQRLTACLEFLDDKLRVFPGLAGRDEGWLFSEIEPRSLANCGLGFAVNTLPDREAVLTWYLEINSGYVAHTPEELERVETLRAEGRKKPPAPIQPPVPRQIAPEMGNMG